MWEWENKSSTYCSVYTYDETGICSDRHMKIDILKVKSYVISWMPELNKG